MAKRRVLVTGGVGYVGRELTAQLIQEGENVVHVLDNLACGEHRLAHMDQTRFSLHRVDIRDATAVRNVIQEVQPDVVFHLAAVHYIPACEEAPGNAVAVNVVGTVNVLDAMPIGATLVFTSTAAVYAPSSEAHREDDIGSGPVDVYGITKKHCEDFIGYFHRKGLVRAVVVRLFNVVGSGETNPHLAPAIIEQLSDGATELKLGNLFPHRDYIDVSDVAKGLRLLSSAQPSGDGPIITNLGTGRTSSVQDMVRLLTDATGRKVEIIQDQSRVRSVDRPMLKASVERLKEIVSWTPEKTLETSMRNAWATRAEDRLR